MRWDRISIECGDVRKASRVTIVRGHDPAGSQGGRDIRGAAGGDTHRGVTSEGRKRWDSLFVKKIVVGVDLRVNKITV